MRTSTGSLLLLASTLTLAGGCDDGFDRGLVDDGDDIAFRCTGTNCGLGLGNTSRIGDHLLSNLSETKLVSAPNDTAGVRIEGGTAKYMGTTMSITEIDVKADGELKLKLGTAGWIGGTAVKGATFYLYLDPLNGDPTISAELKIFDAWCSPGEYDSTMTICRYQFLTNVVPEDTDAYPMSEKEFGWYHTCPDEDEMGELDDSYKWSSVLSPNVSLFSTGSLGPRIDVTPGTFINGCINGAVSTGQYWLNAFYDASAYRGLHASQRTAMLRAWMAWHGGQSRTIPGRKISMDDRIGNLFDWTSDPNWSIEAGYGAPGARCRGSSVDIGMHRQWIDPVLSLPGWASLPHCTDNNLNTYAVLGVKVQADLW
jgi:hypothetical protein